MPIARRDGGSHSLSTSTIIIIAVVCGAIVLLVFALFLWRLIARSCRRANAPLPPVQGLAHHREAQLAAQTPNPRPVTQWAAPHRFLHPDLASDSDASLIRNSLEFSSRSPTREASWAPDDTLSAEGSPFNTSLHTPMSHDLAAPSSSYFPVAPHSPNSPFPSDLPSPDPSYLHSADPSMTGSSSDHDDAPSPAPTGPTLPTDSTTSLPQTIATPRPRSQRQSVGRNSRGRPLSMASSINTLNTAFSHNVGGTGGNVIRGAPHSMHSSIQIVLPAPLAPELYPPVLPFADSPRASIYGSPEAGASRRSVVADQWLQAGSGSRPASAGAVRRESSGSSLTPPRRQLQQHQGSLARTSDPSLRRSLSRTRGGEPSPAPRTPKQQHRASMVPRLPSQYEERVSWGPVPDMAQERDRDRERGRPVRTATLPPGMDGPRPPHPLSQNAYAPPPVQPQPAPQWQPPLPHIPQQPPERELPPPPPPEGQPQRAASAPHKLRKAR